MEIKKLLKLMADKNATDLLLATGAPPVLRIASKLIQTDYEILNQASAKELIFSMLSAGQKEKFEAGKELDFPYEIKGVARFRVNLHMQKGSVAASLRIIPTDIPTLEDLRLPKPVADIAHIARGLVLVSGPTGSGKTTTQACMIDIINQSRNCHIITIEDPIEYIHKHKKSIIEQREVGVDTNSFGTALRHILRQDPDVILIGEMRDLESIQVAITAAETGHLVISTLHTNDAVQAIDRMVDVFPPHQQSQVRLQLSLVLQGIIAQQLIPRADGSGLVVATEILKITSGIRNIIRKAQTQEIYSMMEIGAKYGMQTMDSTLKQLYQSKLIKYDDAIARAINPEQLSKIISE
jgi:twitching motility protein PilT